MSHYHDEVHQDEVHPSAGGKFGPQLFYRGGAVVCGEEGGAGEGAVLLALDNLHDHFDVQSGVVLQRETQWAVSCTMKGIGPLN